MDADTRAETSTLKRWAQLYFNPSGRIGRREWWLHGVLGVAILTGSSVSPAKLQRRDPPYVIDTIVGELSTEISVRIFTPKTRSISYVL